MGHAADEWKEGQITEGVDLPAGEECVYLNCASSVPVTRRAAAVFRAFSMGLCVRTCASVCEDGMLGGFPMGQWLSLHLPMKGLRAQSPVGELWSHMPPGQDNQDLKQKQHCNNLNKDFKTSPHQKKINREKMLKSP